MLEQPEHIVDRRRQRGRCSAIAVTGNHVVVERTVGNGGFRQQFEGRPVVWSRQHETQPRLVVFQICLSAYGQHVMGVHTVDVFPGGRAPAAAAQMLVQMVEEQLHMVGYQVAQAPTHGRTHIGGELEAVGLRQCLDATGGRGPVPGFQGIGGVDVRMGR